MVDITTNNYQKAIESFFSHYCSYALTLYFQELKGVKKVEVTADTRQALLGAGFDRALIDDDGILEIDFSELATEYFVEVRPRFAGGDGGREAAAHLVAVRPAQPGHACSGRHAGHRVKWKGLW